jgi:hypothetical protein
MTQIALHLLEVESLVKQVSCLRLPKIMADNKRTKRRVSHRKKFGDALTENLRGSKAPVIGLEEVSIPPAIQVCTNDLNGTRVYVNQASVALLLP